MKKELKFPIGEEKSFNARCPWNIGDETDINEVISFFVSAHDEALEFLRYQKLKQKFENK